MTPLIISAGQGLRDIVELLLAHSETDINATDIRGHTPLMLAVEKGHKKIVEMLLRCREANPNVSFSRGLTPLILSARQGLEDIVELLLRHSAIDVNSKDLQGRSALSWAASGEMIDIGEAHFPNGACSERLKYLFPPGSPEQLSRRAMLMRREKTTFGVPQPSIRPNCKAIVELLLGATGVDVNSDDYDGCTPLFWAAMNGRDELVELLLNDDRVDPGRREFAGFTARDLASDNVREKWSALIRKTRTHESTESEV